MKILAASANNLLLGHGWTFKQEYYPKPNQKHYKNLNDKNNM